MPVKFVLKRKNSSQTTNNSILAEQIFAGEMLTIGSDYANDLVLEQSQVEQAVIIREGEHLTLMNRAEGTILNDRVLRREAIEPLAIGDTIRIADYAISIEEAEAEPEKPANVYSTSEDEMVDVYATTPDVPVDVYATTKFTLKDIAEPSAIAPTALPEPRGSSQPAATPQPEPFPQRNFAEILDTLRTEDDSFYFTVKTGGEEIERIALDQTETPLGTTSGGEIVTENFTGVCAVARKDWSGILIEAAKANAVIVNGEKIIAPRRLRHDDEIMLTGAPRFSLVLHEPSSLVALESLLSSRSPNADTRFGNLGANNQLAAAQEKLPAKTSKESFLERRYFKHFSFFELVSMIIGTLIGAVLIFLLLEFIFS